MEPEPDPVDVSVLDPRRDSARWNAAVSRVAQRGIELRRLRRAVMRRGMIALAVSAAAAILLWFSAPKRHVEPARSSDLLDWATRDVGADDVLHLGGPHAQ